MELDSEIRAIVPQVSKEDFGTIIDKLVGFSSYLIEVNPRINIVSRNNTQELISGLILDSLFILKHADYAFGARLLDIGSGAGFPGLIQKIVRPDLELISVDSNHRKIEFQRSASAKINLEGCQFLSKRIESVEMIPVDYATAKAFGSVAAISRLSRPHIKAGGILVLPRGGNELEFDQIPGDGFVLIERREYSTSLTSSATLLLFRRNA